MKTGHKIIIIAIVITILPFYFVRALSFTTEIHQHNMQGAEGNKVYLLPEGKGASEAVFDLNGNPVTDPANEASYNYFYYREYPVRHFLFDRVPWIMWGNSSDDPTSKFERSIAYGKDLFDGLIRAALPW